MKKNLHFSLSSPDGAPFKDSLCEILFAGLKSLGHIPRDCACSALSVSFAFFEGGAEGCKLRPILNPVTIEIDIPIERQQACHDDQR